MQRIGLVTIGQSPRIDVVPDLRGFLPNGIELIEVGALDGLSSTEIAAHLPTSKDRTLCSRLADGMEVLIDSEFVHHRLRKVIHRLESDVNLIAVLCSGDLPKIRAGIPVLLPYELICGLLLSLSVAKRWGILVPKPDQVVPAVVGLNARGIEAVGDSLSPYVQGDCLEGAVRRLCTQGVDAILLDCIGYSRKMEERTRIESGKPVVSIVSVVGHTLSTLVGGPDRVTAT